MKQACSVVVNYSVWLSVVAKQVSVSSFCRIHRNTSAESSPLYVDADMHICFGKINFAKFVQVIVKNFSTVKHITSLLIKTEL